MFSPLGFNFVFWNSEMPRFKVNFFWAVLQSFWHHLKLSSVWDQLKFISVIREIVQICIINSNVWGRFTVGEQTYLPGHKQSYFLLLCSVANIKNWIYCFCLSTFLPSLCFYGWCKHIMIWLHLGSYFHFNVLIPFLWSPHDHQSLSLSGLESAHALREAPDLLTLSTLVLILFLSLDDFFNIFVNSVRI